MYIEKGKPVSINEIKNFLHNLAEEKLNSKYTTAKEKKSISKATAEDYSNFANQLYQVNKNLLEGRDVFAVIEKEPSNLDRGRHYFSICYINAECKIQKISGGNLYPLIGQTKQEKFRYLPTYLFDSGAIGMSRLLDATDTFFYILKRITGTYAQL